MTALIILLIDLIIRVGLLLYIPRNRKPTAATAWLLLIYILPIVGAIIFFVLGNTKLSKRRRDDHTAASAHTEKIIRKLKPYAVKKTSHTHSILATELTGIPALNGNDVEILHGYNSIIDDMTEAIQRAESHIYVEFYAMTFDSATEEFFEALASAKQRGVAVHILFDTLGSRVYPGYKKMRKFLNEHAIDWRLILPIRPFTKRYNRPDLRNHRKILVIDNKEAYIGSMNIIDKTYHRKDDISYLELVAHLRGPAAIAAATVFASDWYAETEALPEKLSTLPSFTQSSKSSVAQIVPSGPSYPYAIISKFSHL